MAGTKLILDPASSMRSFYLNKNDERVIYGDIREAESHTLTNGRTIHINPEIVLDYRALPFQDNSFKMVIFDPPHLTGLSPKSWIRKKYGVLNKETWKQDLKQAFTECFRVLQINGVLVFKWNDTSILLKEILKLTNQKPIIGHKSAKRMLTHWVLFMKEPINA